MKTGKKTDLPFRLGTSSFIIPADIIPNVEFLAERVDDVQLLLLETDDGLSLPDKDIIKRLRDLALEHELTYSIHLPLDSRYGSQDEAVRKQVVTNCLTSIDAVAELEPPAYVIHFHGDDNDHRSNPPTNNIEAWKSNIEKSVSELLASGIDSRKLCVETLFYPFELVEDIISKYDLSVCLDIGHVLLGKGPLQKYVSTHLERTPVLHVHGILDFEDHHDISYLDPDLLSDLISTLRKDSNHDRVFTIEVFNQNDFEKSMKIMEQYL